MWNVWTGLSLPDFNGFRDYTGTLDMRQEYNLEFGSNPSQGSHALIHSHIYSQLGQYRVASSQKTT